MKRQKEAKAAYLKKKLSFVDLNNLRPIKIVINSGNGVAGPIIDEITVILKKRNVEFEFFLLNHHPDSSFPNGIPNPILKENQSETSDIVVQEKADFGVAFDGDFDRCFLFDHFGNFVSGEYVVGLLAQVFLENNRKEKIVYDPRVIWNTLDVINKHGGDAVVSKTGHAFMKRTMREVNAIYGGEMSAHHYFRDFGYCDSGMIPWLSIWELLSKKETSLFNLILERKNLYPSSGEINFKVSDASKCMKVVKDYFADDAKLLNEKDGLSMSFEDWRLNCVSLIQGTYSFKY